MRPAEASRAILATLIALPALHCQASLVVPAQAGSADAPGIGWFAGLEVPLRQQVILGASHLSGARGKVLRGLWLRRDAGSYRADLSAGEADVTIRLSVTPIDANAPSERFDANRGRNEVVVFAGRVRAPASPPVGPGYDPWGAANTVRIKFTKGFPYAGGNLCIECIGTPVAGRRTKFWPIDYQRAGNGGTVTTIGKTCTKVPLANPETASAWADTMRVGASAVFTAHARPKTAASMLIGVRRYVPALSLGFLGAAGCHLYVQPMVELPRWFGGAWDAGAAAYGTIRLPVPRQTRLLGATLLVQWVHLETTLPRSEWTNPAGLTTSNAVRATLAAQAPATELATVDAIVPAGRGLPASGRVRVDTAPVVRLQM